MAVTARVLFDRPQREIASLVVRHIRQSSSVSIVTGFATPGGVAALSSEFLANPGRLATFVVGAATYPAFDAFDQLLAAGVPGDRLFVHLGHTRMTGGKKNPFARFHPMLHSKIYLMELPGARSCAFIGSHNVTSFALTGLNGEAAVMLEGPRDSIEFQEIRNHVQVARSQATQYSPALKEAYAWWLREFVEGLRSEIKSPQDWVTVRTILVFAEASAAPGIGDQIYFEIPAGIEQLESLKTEVHLYLFATLPSTAWQALHSRYSALASITCTVIGAENRQGNKELAADWLIEEVPHATLKRVAGGVHRPLTPVGKQQVRAEVRQTSVEAFDYSFERERLTWSPELAGEEIFPSSEAMEPAVIEEARGGKLASGGWRLVTGLYAGVAFEKDQEALGRASPEAGAYLVVSLRRRRAAKTADV